MFGKCATGRPDAADTDADDVDQFISDALSIQEGGVSHSLAAEMSRSQAMDDHQASAKKIKTDSSSLPSALPSASWNEVPSVSTRGTSNPKSVLNEWCQKRNQTLPKYEVVENVGSTSFKVCARL